MKCPHCSTEFEIPYRAETNVDVYGKSALISAPCCKRGVTVFQVRRMAVAPYHGSATEDDWGEPIV